MPPPITDPELLEAVSALTRAADFRWFADQTCQQGVGIMDWHGTMGVCFIPLISERRSSKLLEKQR
jgi:hypothetical protein